MRVWSVAPRIGSDDGTATVSTEDQQSIAVLLAGKTYSLRGPFRTIDDYYSKIPQVVDLYLGRTSVAGSLLSSLRTMSTKRRFFRKLAAAPEESDSSFLITHFVSTSVLTRWTSSLN